MEVLDDGHKLLEIYQQIKEVYLSRTCFPKLMVGTGLSVCYGIAGMDSLSTVLKSNFEKFPKTDELRIQWDGVCDSIYEFGLEKGLEGLDYRNTSFIDMITKYSAELILDGLYDNLMEIKEKDTGFKKLLSYLLNSCSTNNKLVDIMTPNYDLIIELICDSLGVEIIDGFTGNIYNQFNHDLIKFPKNKVHLNKDYRYVRLFKPHGSINWLSTDKNIVKVNDYSILKKNIDKVSIIAPGGDKYRQGMITTEFRIIREEFNNLLTGNDTKSVLIYGYGFNDDHFNNAIFERQSLPILVITRGIRTDIIEKLKLNINAVAFYKKDSINLMLYKGSEYTIGDQMWNIDVFSNKIIS